MNEQTQDHEELSKVLAFSRNGKTTKQIASALGLSEARVWQLIKLAEIQPPNSELSSISIEPISAMFASVSHPSPKGKFADIIPAVAKLEPDQCLRILYPICDKRHKWIEGLRVALKKQNIQITTRTKDDVIWIARASKH